MSLQCQRCQQLIPELPEAICPCCLAKALLQEDDSAAWLDESSTEPDIIQHIGRYALLERIGEGGFGDVYRARQTDPIERQVAVKVIKPGMDTRQVIARFEAERQALALMDHPGIAQVLDAGETSQGLPYFIMELVPDGLPITTYAQQKDLDQAAKLTLLCDVCQAVQHAHDRGIIHRDLKPSNLLVHERDGQACVKIIDFGIAKATAQVLSDKTLFTHSQQLLGTIEYMSPEQAAANSLTLDGRTDVYALGIVLIELLVGRTPITRELLAKLPYDELVSRLRQKKPIGPSALTDSPIEPQLDVIALKATARDRADRYESAQAFGEDLKRFLQGAAIHARPPRKHLPWPIVAGLSAIIVAGILSFQPRQTSSETSPPPVPPQLADHADFPSDVARQCDHVRRHPEDVAAVQKLLHFLSLGNYPTRAMPPLPHQGYVHHIKVSEKEILTSSSDGYLRWWEMKTGSPALKPFSLGASVSQLIQSADGQRFAAGSVQGAVTVWRQGKAPMSSTSIAASEHIVQLAFNEDNSVLFVLTVQGSLIAWDVVDGNARWRTRVGQGKQAYDMAQIGDQLYVGTASRGLAIHEASTGEHVQTVFPHLTLRCLLSTKDASLCLWGDLRGAVGAIDCQRLEIVYEKQAHDTVQELMLSPTGDLFVSAGLDGAVKLHSVGDGTLQHGYQHRSHVYGLCFNPSGTLLASASKDHSIRLWRIDENQAYGAPIVDPHTLSNMTFDASGKTLFAGGSSPWAHAWQVNTTTLFNRHETLPEWFLSFVECYLGERLTAEGRETISWETFKHASDELRAQSHLPQDLYQWALAHSAR